MFKSLLEHSDIVINVLSTVTLDAFLFDKPVINPVFGNKSNGMYNDQKFLKYRHLEHLVDSGSSIIARVPVEFIDAIIKLLSGQDDKGLKRKEFINLEIGESLVGTSQRIVKALKEFATLNV